MHSMDVKRLYNKEFLEQMAQKASAENQKLVKKLRAKKPKNLDVVIHKLHDEVFDEIDCLECGNCCRSLGPRVLMKDIERLSKQMRLKPNDFIETYLRVDEDNDYVFKEMPCPFLGHDNYCFVYGSHPKACQEYPHTDEKKMVKHLSLMLKNCSTCPVVYLVFEGLKKRVLI